MAAKHLTRTTYFERLQTALTVMCTATPPLDLLKRWAAHDDCDLQDWVGRHMRPEITWAQCIGVIDAAEALAVAPEEGRPEVMHLTLPESLAGEVLAQN